MSVFRRGLHTRSPDPEGASRPGGAAVARPEGGGWGGPGTRVAAAAAVLGLLRGTPQAYCRRRASDSDSEAAR